MNHQFSSVSAAPPPAYTLAMLASLSTDQRFVEAFNRWQAVVDVDELPAGQFPLLPLICRNLEHWGIDHPWLPRLKGVYRKIWYNNQLTLRTLAGALTALAEADIPTLLVGGAPLALTVYPEPAQRPISVPEIVVPAQLAVVAVTRLQTAGWQPTPLFNTKYLAWRPGWRFTNTLGQVLQLWWYALPTTPAVALDTAFWDRATPLLVDNAPTKTLDPTDHLLWVCQQAAWYIPIGLADAAQLMHRHAIEWSRLLATAQEYRLGLFTAYCLSTLVEALHSAVPPEILAALRQIPPRNYEQQAQRAFLTPPADRSVAQRFWLHYGHYRRAAEYRGVPVTPFSFGRYWRYIRQSRAVILPPINNNNGYQPTLNE